MLTDARKLCRSMRKALLMLRGYNLASVNKLFYLEGICEHKKGNSIGFDEKQLFSLLPFDAKFSKLFGDVFSLYYLLEDCGDLLPQCYFLISNRDGSPFVLPFSRDEDGFISATGEGGASFDAVIQVIKEKRSVRARNAANSFDTRELLIRYSDEGFSLNGKSSTATEIVAVLSSLGADAVVTESAGRPDDSTLHVGFVNEGVGEPRFLYASLVKTSFQGSWYERNREICSIDETGRYDGGKVERFDELLVRLKGISAAFKELEYMSFALRKTKSGLKILQVDTGDDLSFIESVPPELESFLVSKVKESGHLVSPKRLAAMACRWMWGAFAKRRGFMDYMYRNWVRDCISDYLDPSFSLRDKRWTHKRGFLSFRKSQYGLTDCNYKQCLSDYDYRWLRPLNGVYRKWLWDKVSLRYAMAKYACYLPEYYFHVLIRGGRLFPMTMPDCPPFMHSGDVGQVVELLRRNGCLAMKPTVGSHGEGFFKLEYARGSYAVNGLAMDVDEVKTFLMNRKEGYVITEYVDMHPDLKRIYADAACTVRLMVINRTGIEPVIENAYFRIGTSASGHTDNIGSGGVFAYVDVDTGFYHDAEAISEHVIRPCPCHPDTGVLIEGHFPHWESIKKGVLDMSRYMSPLEYLGFDVVVTESEFKVLEVNTHQDLHRYPTYGKRVHDYFMEKVALKKAGKRLA